MPDPDLMSVTGGSTESYVFDVVGNRTASHLSSSYSYSPFNRLTATQTATYNFDPNGNTVAKAEGSNFWRYGFDYENRVTSVANRRQTVRYVYDALGRRVRRHIKGSKENTKFTYEGEDVLLDDDVVTGATKYLNGPGIDNKLRQTNGSTTSYFLADHLGSTNGLTNASGSMTASNSYDSFGNPSNASFPTRYQFTGREFDNFSGLQYSRARFYDPNIGRFISEDPIGFAGGDVNLYGYVTNQPLWYRDPLGLQPGADVMADPNARRLGAAALAATGFLVPPLGVAIVGGAAIYVAWDLGDAIARHPSNPLSRPWIPTGTPLIPPAIAARPAGPVCQPLPRAIPWTRSPDIPFSTPSDGPDKCEIQYEMDSEICRYLPTKGARGRCWESAAERLSACNRNLPWIPPLVTW